MQILKNYTLNMHSKAGIKLEKAEESKIISEPLIKEMPRQPIYEEEEKEENPFENLNIKSAPQRQREGVMIYKDNFQSAEERRAKLPKY